MCATAPAPKETRTISRRQSVGRPTSGFDRFELRPELQLAVREAGFTTPRPVQERALPPALEGRDVLGLAQTGTGKTAAFALPILQRLAGQRGPGPRALIVCPTRELAAQVHAEIERLGAHVPVTAAVVFGGVPLARQERALQRRPDIVVACPGRLLDLVGRKSLRLDRVEVLVLDEADHMFDMGFLPDVRRILRELPSRRQNLMYSATMPREIRSLADTVLRDPVVVECSHSRPAETVSHALYPLDEGEKVGVLERLLEGDDFRSAIVFLRTKRRAKRLAQRLEDRGHRAAALQGNMSQAKREQALRGFREGRYTVLVATDIAARGLDVAGVSHVVNFDVPTTADAYTHRIGRTGRSECTGTAFTFVTGADAAVVRAIERTMGGPIERLRVADLGKIERASLTGGGRTQRSPAASSYAPAGRARGPARRGPAARPANGPRSKPKARSPKAKPAPATAAVRERAPSAPAAPFGVGVFEEGAPTRRAQHPSGESESRPRRRRRRRRVSA